MKGHRQTPLFTSCTCVGIPFHQIWVSLSSQHICNSLCFLPSACCWVWKRWICSPRVTDIVQIRHFNSSSSWIPNWPCERGNRWGQSVVIPYSTCGDCISLHLCNTQCNGVMIQTRPLSSTVRSALLLTSRSTAVRRRLWDLHYPCSDQPHSCALSEILSVLLSHCCHLSPSLGATPVPAEWFNDLLNSTTPRWLCRCWDVWVSADISHMNPQETGNKGNSDTTEPLSDYFPRNSPPVGKNKEQTWRSKKERSWLLNRCRWLFQVQCRRETGKEMGVKPKNKGAGISNR